MAAKNTTKKRPGIVRLGKKVKKIYLRLRNKRRQAVHKSFALSRHQKFIAKPTKVPRSLKLLKQTLVFLKRNWKLYLSLSTIYLLLLWVVLGLPNQQGYSDLKALVDETLGGEQQSWLAFGSLLAGVLGGVIAGDQSELQQFLNWLVSIVFWLVFIWATRHKMAGNPVGVRMALYNAMTPLIPLLTVLFIVALQLIPGSIGALVLSFTFTGGGLVNGVEAMLFSLGAFILILVSLYWLIQSLLAAIVVTLPNMYPLQAMSSAKELVSGRRFVILRRLAVVMIAIALVWVAALLLAIVLDSYSTIEWLPIVPLVLNVLTACTVPVMVIYLYHLYRKLL